MDLLLPRQKHTLQQEFGELDNLRIEPGGHMAYRRALFENGGENFFVKAHDPTLLNDERRREEMLYFLEKEHRLYEHLSAKGYPHAPSEILFTGDMLVLEGLTTEAGWRWKAPTRPELQQTFAQDVIDALGALTNIPGFDRTAGDEVTLDTFYDDGWGLLHDINLPQLIERNLQRWPQLPEVLRTSARNLSLDAGSFAVKRIQINQEALNHHDARQNNIAWHPEFGVKIADWSWADPGLIDGDSTMFLLDLYKSGVDIAPYHNQFNPIYAKLLLGYWLQRSQTEHMEGNDIVRMHQFISAVKAAEALQIIDRSL